MADEETGAPAAAATPKLTIQVQYVRDSSFENVAVQKNNVRTDAKPEIEVNVNLDAKKRSEMIYEVILKLAATAKSGENTMFIAELEYAGLFKIENVPDDKLHPLLLIECPRIIFPFARRIIADMTRDGGYPPLMLDMIDFTQLYRQEAERRRAASEASVMETEGTA